MHPGKKRPNLAFLNLVYLMIDVQFMNFDSVDSIATQVFLGMEFTLQELANQAWYIVSCFDGKESKARPKVPITSSFLGRPLIGAGDGFIHDGEDDDLADELLVGFEDGVSWLKVLHGVC